jgi:hypothetical protein
MVPDDSEVWVPGYHMITLLDDLRMTVDSLLIVEVPLIVFAEVTVVRTFWIQRQPGINRLGSMDNDRELELSKSIPNGFESWIVDGENLPLLSLLSCLNLDSFGPTRYVQIEVFQNLCHIVRLINLAHVNGGAKDKAFRIRVTHLHDPFLVFFELDRVVHSCITKNGSTTDVYGIKYRQDEGLVLVEMSVNIDFLPRPGIPTITGSSARKLDGQETEQQEDRNPSKSQTSRFLSHSSSAHSSFENPLLILHSTIPETKQL